MFLFSKPALLFLIPSPGTPVHPRCRPSVPGATRPCPVPVWQQHPPTPQTQLPSGPVGVVERGRLVCAGVNLRSDAV